MPQSTAQITSGCRIQTDWLGQKRHGSGKGAEKVHRRCVFATLQRSTGRRFTAATALEEGDVLLTGHRAGVISVYDVNTGTCVTRQCEQVNALALKQPESDGAVAKAVHAARLAVGPNLEAGLGEYPVQVEA